MYNIIKKNIILILLIVLISINSAIAMTPGEIKSTIVAANIARTQKKYAISINLAESVLKEEPQNYLALCVLGMAYGEKGEAQKAINSFSKASEYNPNEWSANSFLGDIYMQLKGYYIAKDYYKKVLENKKLPVSAKSYFENQVKICEQMLDQKFEGERPNINVQIPFNLSEWHIKGLNNEEKIWSVEYSYKNENIKNGQWSKLVTINCFKNLPITLNEYYLNTINDLEIFSKSLNKNFKYKLISKDEKEIVYEWNLGNGEEVEISRIIKDNAKIYHLHYAQKSNLSDEQRSEWLEILRKSKIIK